jgi:F0F1-type ATP synthase assembly protein I
MMELILGIIIGLAIGGLLVHLAHEYIDSMLKKDEEEWK